MRDEAGQTLAEYAVVLSVISLAVIGVFAGFSQGVQNVVARAIEALASGF